jgi:hypothetical protein
MELPLGLMAYCLCDNGTCLKQNKRSVACKSTCDTPLCICFSHPFHCSSSRSEHRPRGIIVAFTASPPTRYRRQWRAFENNSPRWPWPAFRVAFDVWWSPPLVYIWPPNNCDPIPRAAHTPTYHWPACQTAQRSAPELRTGHGEQCERYAAVWRSHVVPRRPTGRRVCHRQEHSIRQWIRTPLHERFVNWATAYC